MSASEYEHRFLYYEGMSGVATDEMNALGRDGWHVLHCHTYQHVNPVLLTPVWEILMGRKRAAQHASDGPTEASDDDGS